MYPLIVQNQGLCRVPAWPREVGTLRKINSRHEQGFKFRAGVLHHRRGWLFLDRRQLALRRRVERSYHPFERPVLSFFVHPRKEKGAEQGATLPLAYLRPEPQQIFQS
jgi:hypothetical protein